MIYGRFGDVVEVVRMGTLDDVVLLEEREPDRQDREAIKNGSYVVVRRDNGIERLYHLAYLKADNGFAEIQVAISKLETK